MSSVCQVIDVDVLESSWNADPLWIGIAFLIGFIIGLLLSIPCMRCCVRNYFKKKHQDEEMLLIRKRQSAHSAGYIKSTEFSVTSTTTEEYRTSGSVITQRTGSASSPNERVLKRRLSRRSSKKGKKDDWVHLVEFGVQPEEQVTSEPMGKKGLSDALIQPNGDAMDLELNNQDFDFILYLEKELRDGRILTFNQLVKMLLNHLFQNGKVSPEFYKNFAKEVREALISLLNIILEDQKNAEEKIRKDPKYANDPVGMQKAIEKLPTKFASKLTNLLKDEQENVRTKLLKGSELSEDEVNDIISQLTAGLAATEIKFSDQVNQQAASFEERLSRRKQLAALKNIQKKEENDEIQARREALTSTLQQAVVDGKMTQKQVEDILKEYNDNLVRLQDKHDLNVLRQQQNLNDKLAQKRLKKINDLREKHTEETEDLLTRFDQETNTGEFIQAYNSLREVQLEEKEHLIDELDAVEILQMNEIAKNETEDRRDEIDKAEEDFMKQLQLTTGMTEMEANRILRIHEQEMEEYDRLRKAERKKMQAEMAEKLAQRKQAMNEANSRLKAQQAAIRDQQQNTLNKVLAGQTELDEEAKKKILVEHEKNMQAINNQLQVSRLRQQKQLELKLCERKAKFAEIKEQKEKAKRIANQKEREKIENDLAAQVEAEEKRYEEERKRAVEEMRMRLKQETDEALKAQEAQMGILIGRLQVGKARRAAIIEKQDKTIQKLQDQLTNKVKGGNMTDQLLQQHYNNVSHLNEQLQMNRERQEQMLLEKLQAKKLRKEREIDNQIENEAIQEMDENARRQGASRASNILTQVMMENRHKQAIQQLEKEMDQELRKHRDELNKQFEQELQTELEEQRKSFLVQLASISDLSKEEINDIVDSAVKESGTSGKDAKTLAKQLRADFVRARTSADLAKPDEEDPRGRNRQRTEAYDNDSYENNEDYPPSRPKSGRRRSRPPASEDDDEE